MKKKFFFAAVVLVALASCANEEIIGDSPTPNPEKASDAIVFNSGAFKITRAGDLVGEAAAEKLNNKFVVYGIKHAAAEVGAATNDEIVFQNYGVVYTANSAGTTASNSQNWEYVGKSSYDAVSPKVSTQAIKYWDYSAAQGYTFYGIAADEDMSEATPKVTVTKITSGTTVYDKGYSVVVKSGANLNKLFVSDRTPVVKNDYNKPVLLKFRNFGARVRVGFYETIPGYKVKIDNFYIDDDADAVVTTFGAMEDAQTTFAASLDNISKAADNTLTVSYYNATDASIENHAKLTPSTATYNHSLVLGGNIVSATELATSTALPTWDTSGGTYTSVFPYEQNANPMLVKVDYTLTAEDGAGETIKVTGATAVVPTQYVQWKSNFAYTYIFKISDNSNGYTGETTDPAGLYPITLDAAVIAVEDDKTQETITTFSDYSITTYANGSKVTTNNEYLHGEDIYVVKTNNSTGAVVAPSAIGVAAGNAQVYTVTTTGTEGISEATVLARLLGSPNGITLTATSGGAAASLVADGKVPAADGTDFDFGAKGAVKFTPGSAGTYVYVFTRTAYVAPTYASANSATYSASTTYYFKTTSDVYYTAPGINEDNFDANKANLYTQTDAGTAGAYDIKIIKVQ